MTQDRRIEVPRGKLHTVTIHKVFPATQSQQLVITKLSILDATVARFAPCSAIWFYDKIGDPECSCPILFERVKQALSKTLDYYPHFAGQLQWSNEKLVKEDTNPHHLGRPVVIQGTGEDPGVEFITAAYERDLCDIVPSHEDRSTTTKVWDATNLPQHDLVPKTSLSLHDLRIFKGLPSVAVQLTAFGCGGFSIGVKISHCLADAACLLQFMHYWASQTRALSAESLHDIQAPLKPLLNFKRFDQAACLHNDETIDLERIDKARSLPMHRFDWWADNAPGYPPWATKSGLGTKPSSEHLTNIELSPSSLPPWATWDMTAAVTHTQIRLSADELSNMKDSARNSLPYKLQAQRVSKLDAVLAHIWLLINRARQHESLHEPVYLDITLGLRKRIEPQLPDNFPGSPILLGYVAKTGTEAMSASIGSIAGSIRQMMSRFTSDAVAAYIYDAAHEVSPQRLWQAFLGSRHTLVTSWTRIGAYEVDFCGTGDIARYVQGVMPRMDGLVQVIDVGETGDLDVSLCLETQTMARLLADLQ
ncbi:Fc.00g026360.m01.CDS01 [Cosmosporella sp. VM-42]